MEWCKIQRKSRRIGDFSHIINIQLLGLWKNSLKFRGSSFHSIDESIESKSCFKICPMKMTQRSDPIECSWLEQYITSSDFCGQFLDAQFFVALLSLQRSLQKSWNAILRVDGGGSARKLVTRGNEFPPKKISV